jgi:molybdenum cofactor cytidylyltransferase
VKFGPVPLNHAQGKILGHHISGPKGRRAFRKGKPLTRTDIEALKEIGRKMVYVAELEPDDVDEDAAARRLAQAVKGSGLRSSRVQVGRVNLQAQQFGILRVHVDRLLQINRCEGITLATLASNTVVYPASTVGTVKIIPFAVPEASVRIAERIAAGGEAIISVQPFRTRGVSLIFTGSATARERVLANFESPLQYRIENLGSEVRTVDYLPLEDEQGEVKLSYLLTERVSAGADLVILAGETAIMDRYDIAPRAVECAGGEVTCFGAPVDPGNLLMLAYLGDVPILGAPGCARSPKPNVIDWVLPRLLVGERLSREDLLVLGHGGLLEDTPLRPAPRERIGLK